MVHGITVHGIMVPGIMVHGIVVYGIIASLYNYWLNVIVSSWGSKSMRSKKHLDFPLGGQKVPSHL